MKLYKTAKRGDNKQLTTYASMAASPLSNKVTINFTTDSQKPTSFYYTTLELDDIDYLIEKLNWAKQVLEAGKGGPQVQGLNK